MIKKYIFILLFVVSFCLILFFIVLNNKYNSTDNETLFSSTDTEIGVLKIDGIITDSDDILKKIRVLKKRNKTKAVIVRINSPGGAVSPSQEIYEELKKLDQIKPVVASLSSLAASGGYYIAIGAKKIVANAGTLTGSIGVIMNLVDLQELYKLIKVSPYNIKSGKFKDIGNSNKVMTKEGKAILQAMSDDIHMQFKQAVSESRKIPMDNLANIADGRVFTGKQAFDLGLVDFIGTFEDAIILSSNLAGIDANSELYYPKVKKESLKSLLYEMNSLLKLITNKLSVSSFM